MGHLELIELPDAEAVAERVAADLLLARRRRPQRPLGLATGRTMEPVYGALVRLLALLPAAEQQRLRQQWLSFNLDEYVGLAADDPRSFSAEMERRLVRPLGLDPQTVRLPRGVAADPGAEARRYGAELAAAGGLGLQLLGLGLNGHVGFNEPPCAADAPCRCVVLSEATRMQNAAAFGADPAAVPARAITVGLAEILAAERILLVVTGAAKAPVLRRVLEEPPCPALPASWLRLHPAVRVIADGAALRRGL
jgi:glucosamine-6-phosphate deaminase